MQQWIKQLENFQKTLIKSQRKVWYALSEYILGEVNLQNPIKRIADEMPEESV